MKFLHKSSILLLASLSSLAIAAKVPATLNDNVITCNPGPGCSSKIMFGRNYNILQTDRFIVMVSISTEGPYTRADVSIANNTGISQNLSPEDFRVEVISPKPRVLPYVPPAELKNLADQSIPTSEAAKALPIPPVGALDASFPKESAAEESTERAAAQKHLEATSIPPNEVIRGRVYFQRDRASRLINVVLPVAGLVFEFPYSPKR